MGLENKARDEGTRNLAKKERSKARGNWKPLKVFLQGNGLIVLVF